MEKALNRSDQTKLLDWRGRTAVVMGSGPSWNASEAALVHGAPGVKTIAVNSTMFSHLFADVGYSGDFLFFKTYAAQLRGRPGVWTCDKASAERWGYSWVKGTNRQGLGTDGALNMLGNSGFQAIQLAYLFGARRILLLGFDMRLGSKGERHHHPDHPAPCVQEQLFAEWIHKAEQLAKDLKAADCEVINCTPGSALPWFQMATLEEAIR